MPCEPIRAQLQDGTPIVGVVCTRGVRAKRCVNCGKAADRLCDWKLTGPKAGKTCDRPVCRSCTTRPAPDKDLCPAHARAWASHPTNPNRGG